MAGLGELNTVFHSFAITNLTDQDYIRRLTQRILQRGVPGFSIDANFALRDNATSVRMDILYRVFDGKNIGGSEDLEAFLKDY